MSKRTRTRTGREAKRRRRRHERRSALWIARAAHTTNALVFDWPQLSIDSLQRSFAEFEQMKSDAVETMQNDLIALSGIPGRLWPKTGYSSEALAMADYYRWRGYR